MMPIHAWFSAESALRHGNSVYRKPSGSLVNVTRTSEEKEAKGPHRYDEKYVGEVLRVEDGGCVVANERARSIGG
jgi:hypothetical protein